MDSNVMSLPVSERFTQEVSMDLQEIQSDGERR